jgi:hypothetical protein
LFCRPPEWSAQIACGPWTKLWEPLMYIQRGFKFDLNFYFFGLLRASYTTETMFTFLYTVLALQYIWSSFLFYNHTTTKYSFSAYYTIAIATINRSFLFQIPYIWKYFLGSQRMLILAFPWHSQDLPDENVIWYNIWMCGNEKDTSVFFQNCIFYGISFFKCRPMNLHKNGKYPIKI